MKSYYYYYYYYYFERGSFYVAQAGPEFMILLPQPPECWDYNCVLLPLALKRLF
jgi:hypothetical protein